MSTTTKAIGGVALLIGLAVAVWLIRPLFVDSVVEEDFPLSAEAEVPDDMTQAEVEAEMVAAAAEPSEEATEPMPEPTPAVLASGSFTGADDFHDGAGTATAYELADGSRVLRFEDFTVTNGPDLRVYLAPLGDDGAPDLGEGSVELGRLKGNVGSQNYDIPQGYDLERPLAVVIWCQPFSVLFATAALA